MDAPFDASRYLLDVCQRNFPLTPRPFEMIAEQLCAEGVGGDWNEARVLTTLQSAKEAGALSRVGPVFAPHGIGMSTLAALAVPPEQLDAVAAWINALPEVNHNYRRSHRYNLWFVVTGRDDSDIRATLMAIRRQWPALPLLDLPLLNAFYIDLGFGLDDLHKPDCVAARAEHRFALTDKEWHLVSLIQEGFPLVPRPFQALAQEWGSSEQGLIDALANWLDRGIVKRYGAVVRHRELGYRANAMWVMDIPVEELSVVAQQLAAAPEVRLCYERPRRGSEWPYNLFCMVHGKCRDSVLAVIAQLSARFSLQGYSNAVLIGEHRYKQRGAWYAPPAQAFSRQQLFSQRNAV